MDAFNSEKGELMPANKILERVRRGEKALGLAMGSYTDELVELCGVVGLDFVSYDGQHSASTPEIIDRMCRMADGWGVTPIMRVPDQIPSNILNYLDRGIQAVTIPFLETKEQAEALVQCCMFAPEGRRSYTSQRVTRFGTYTDLKAMMAETNANTIIVPQLETITAYNNLDEIVQVEGIEFFGGGPNDLAQSMGHVGEPDHPECLEVTKQGRARLHAAGKRFFDEVMETVTATVVVRDAAQELLKRHGR